MVRKTKRTKTTKAPRTTKATKNTKTTKASKDTKKVKGVDTRQDDAREVLEDTLMRAVDGAGAHAQTHAVFEGLDWTLAGERPGGAPHSAWQLLNHLLFWNEWGVRWLSGGKPAPPAHADGCWPMATGPASRDEWDAAVARLGAALDGMKAGVRDADPRAASGSKSRLDMVMAIGLHSSYHAGQVAFLRRQLGAWPPPSGGLTG